MGYCRLQSNMGKFLRYAIGSLSSDITGIIDVDSNGRGYTIVKQPQKQEVYPHFINRMLSKYHSEFDKGNIPEKMSYEI